MCSEKCSALSGNQRVRVTGTDIDPANAAFCQRFGAGRLLAVVTAGFQGDVDVRSGRVFGAVLQSVSFCMQVTVPGVPALTDDAVIFDDHGTHQRVGIGEARTAPRQLNGTFHIKGMFCHGNTSENKNSPIMQKA